VQDFAGARILDRLVMYERRIEGSLYRTMAELEKRQRLGRERGVSRLKSAVSSEPSRAWIPPVPDVPEEISDLAVPTSDEPTDGACTNVAEPEKQSCKTNRAPSKAGAIQQDSILPGQRIADRPE